SAKRYAGTKSAARNTTRSTPRNTSGGASSLCRDKGGADFVCELVIGSLLGSEQAGRPGQDEPNDYQQDDNTSQDFAIAADDSVPVFLGHAQRKGQLLHPFGGEQFGHETVGGADDGASGDAAAELAHAAQDNDHERFDDVIRAHVVLDIV